MWESTAWPVMVEQVLSLCKEDKRLCCNTTFYRKSCVKKANTCLKFTPLYALWVVCMLYFWNWELEHCTCYECDRNAKNAYLCWVSCLRFNSFVTTGVIVALQCKLTACVQVPALPNAKAFSPHKLGTWAFSKAILHMNLFSNTVMITIHPVRKYSLFKGYKSISCFFFFAFDPEWHVEFVHKHFCLRWEETRISHWGFCTKIEFGSTRNCLMLMKDHRSSYLMIKDPAKPLPSLLLFCKLMGISVLWIFCHRFSEIMKWYSTHSVQWGEWAAQGWHSSSSQILKHIYMPGVPAGGLKRQMKTIRK